MSKLNLFASSCVLCGDSASDSVSLCTACREDLPWMGTSCSQCGAALPDNTPGLNSGIPCGQCQAVPPAVDYTISALSYLSPVDHLVLQLKFRQQLSCASILADLLYQHLVSCEIQDLQLRPSLILPVPLHPKRLMSRGFNQSLEIARPIGKRLAIPVSTNAIIRIKDTQPQTQLNAKQRRNNLRNGFALKSDGYFDNVPHVVILDDVVTTGATCNELARLLKQAGVGKVGVWSVARA